MALWGQFTYGRGAPRGLPGASGGGGCPIGRVPHQGATQGLPPADGLSIPAAHGHVQLVLEPPPQQPEAVLAAAPVAAGVPAHLPDAALEQAGTFMRLVSHACT